jgi:hypothetical protein
MYVGAKISVRALCIAQSSRTNCCKKRNFRESRKPNKQKKLKMRYASENSKKQQIKC